MFYGQLLLILSLLLFKLKLLSHASLLRGKCRGKGLVEGLVEQEGHLA